MYREYVLLVCFVLTVSGKDNIDCEHICKGMLELCIIKEHKSKYSNTSIYIYIYIYIKNTREK